MGITGIKWFKKETKEDVKKSNAVALSKDEAVWVFKTLREMHNIYPDDKDIKIAMDILNRALT